MKKITCYAALVLATSVSGVARAEPRAEELIAACRESGGGKSGRIACLENAVRTLGGVEVVRDESPAPDATSPAIVPQADAPPAAAVAAAPSGIGAEQVLAREERETKEGRKQRKERFEKEATSARLVDFARTSTGRLVLVLDNGQVWAQRSGDQQEVRLREGDKPGVKIRRGAISGYRIEFDSPNVTIVAERLK